MEANAQPCQPVRTHTPQRRPQVLQPAVDLYERTEDLLLVADLPGVLEQDLQLKVEERSLTLEAKSTATSGDEVVYRRSFVLSADVNAQGASAQLTGGVLKLLLPRKEQTRAHRIPVVTA